MAGREVAHERVDREAVRLRLLEAGFEPALAAVLSAFEGALAEGAEDRVTETVQRVTGRPPRSFEAWAHAHAGAWLRHPVPNHVEEIR